MDDRNFDEGNSERTDFRTLRPVRDDRRQLNRPHLLSPRRGSDTTLPPLHMLQKQRRGSVTDPSYHAAPSSSFRPLDLSRSPPRRKYTHHSLSFHGELPRDDEEWSVPSHPHPHPPPSRHWSQDEVHSNRMEIDENDRSVRPRRQTLPTQLTPLLEPPTLREDPGSSIGHKRKMSLEDMQFPRSADGQGSSSRHDHTSSDPVLPSLKRRGSVATQPMAHLSLHDRRDSIDSPPRDSQSGGQWWRHRSDSNASTNTFSGPPPPPFSESSRGPLHAPYAWPSRPLPPGQSHMHGEGQDSHIVSHRSNHYTSSPPGPPPPMPPPYGHDRRMSAPSGMLIRSPGSADRSLRSRSRPPSRTSEHQVLSPLMSESHIHPSQGHQVDTDDSGGSTGAMKGMTPYSRSPELRVSHKLAERKRRREMKDLFDELRDHLPADRGMKSSKWEILSKAVDYISSMKRNQQEMSREIESLRQELDNTRKFATSSGPAPGVPAFSSYSATPASPVHNGSTSHSSDPVSPRHASRHPPAAGISSTLGSTTLSSEPIHVSSS